MCIHRQLSILYKYILIFQCDFYQIFFFKGFAILPLYLSLWKTWVICKACGRDCRSRFDCRHLIALAGLGESCFLPLNRFCTRAVFWTEWPYVYRPLYPRHMPPLSLRKSWNQVPWFFTPLLIFKIALTLLVPLIFLSFSDNPICILAMSCWDFHRTCVKSLYELQRADIITMFSLFRTWTQYVLEFI